MHVRWRRRLLLSICVIQAINDRFAVPHMMVYPPAILMMIDVRRSTRRGGSSRKPSRSAASPALGVGTASPSSIREDTRLKYKSSDAYPAAKYTNVKTIRLSLVSTSTWYSHTYLSHYRFVPSHASLLAPQNYGATTANGPISPICNHSMPQIGR